MRLSILFKAVRRMNAATPLDYYITWAFEAPFLTS